MNSDQKHIGRAIALAARAWGRTSPNPMVGAVLVKGGKVIAEDYHRRAGEPHAEALVLARAGDKAKGATLYVSLEPCCHSGKRTPPCAKAIIRAGVKRVVVAIEDPNPMVSGKGLRELLNAGVEVTAPVLEDRARRLNEAYIKHVTTGRPFVVMKVAMTLDGKIATPQGESKWITGEKSRLMVHRLRGGLDAVLTAIGTVKADDPELTSRIESARNPIRIIIDPDLEISPNAKALRTPPEVFIVTRNLGEKSKTLEDRGIRIMQYQGKLDLGRLIKTLGGMGITSVLVEGGSSLTAHCLEDGIVDKVMFFIAPKIIGGRESFPAVGGSSFRKLAEAYRVKDLDVKRVGEDVLITGYIA